MYREYETPVGELSGSQILSEFNSLDDILDSYEVYDDHIDDLFQRYELLNQEAEKRGPESIGVNWELRYR